MEVDPEETGNTEIYKSNNYNALILFKIVNVVALLMLYLFLGWFGLSALKIFLQVFGLIGFVAGFSSLFIPHKKENIKTFQILSFFLYFGLLLFFIF